MLVPGATSPPVFLLWGGKAHALLGALPAPGPAADVLSTRHPSYDFAADLHGEGSHFEATAHLVDWWAIGAKRPAACYSHRFVSEGCPSG